MRVERAKYFLAAVETGSLRAAAQKCAISQPALGQQIALLEEELDVVLLVRSRSGVHPTPAGQALVEPFARLVGAEEALFDAAADSTGTYRGDVSIGTISAIVEAIVAPVVGYLRENHPRLKFTISEAASTEVEAAVQSGELDFGVISVPSEPAPQSLRRTVLLSMPIGIVVPSDHVLAEHRTVTWDDLAAWPIVTMRPGTVMWEVLQANVERPNIAVKSMSARSVRTMVKNGAGVGLLAPFDTSSDLLGLAWIAVRGARPVEIGVVQRRDSLPSPSALMVRQLISDRLADLRLQAGG